MVAVLLGSGAAIACTPDPESRGRVAAILPDLTLELDDGRRLALAAIDAPLEPGLDLESVLGVPVVVAKRAKTDRYGRIDGPVYRVAAGKPVAQSLEHTLVARGLARYRPRPGMAACLETLEVAERDARRALRGIWAPSHAMVLPADPKGIPPSRHYRYEIVEGTIVSIGETRSRFYLNFGRFWREDFTVTMTRSAVREFENSGDDPRAWAGRTVTVRGFLDVRDGPLIAVTSTNQIAFPDR